MTKTTHSKKHSQPKRNWQNLTDSKDLQVIIGQLQKATQAAEDEGREFSSLEDFKNYAEKWSQEWAAQNPEKRRMIAIELVGSNGGQPKNDEDVRGLRFYFANDPSKRTSGKYLMLNANLENATNKTLNKIGIEREEISEDFFSPTALRERLGIQQSEETKENELNELDEFNDVPKQNKNKLEEFDEFDEFNEPDEFDEFESTNNLNEEEDDFDLDPPDKQDEFNPLNEIEDNFDDDNFDIDPPSKQDNFDLLNTVNAAMDNDNNDVPPWEHTKPPKQPSQPSPSKNQDYINNIKTIEDLINDESRITQSGNELNGFKLAGLSAQLGTLLGSSGALLLKQLYQDINESDNFEQETYPQSNPSSSSQTQNLEDQKARFQTILEQLQNCNQRADNLTQDIQHERAQRIHDQTQTLHQRIDDLQENIETTQTTHHTPESTKSTQPKPTPPHNHKYDKWTHEELRDHAKTLNIPNYNNLRNSQLVAETKPESPTPQPENNSHETKEPQNQQFTSTSQSKESQTQSPGPPEPSLHQKVFQIGKTLDPNNNHNHKIDPPQFNPNDDINTKLDKLEHYVSQISNRLDQLEVKFILWSQSKQNNPESPKSPEPTSSSTAEYLENYAKSAHKIISLSSDSTNISISVSDTKTINLSNITGSQTIELTEGNEILFKATQNEKGTWQSQINKLNPQQTEAITKLPQTPENFKHQNSTHQLINNLQTIHNKNPDQEKFITLGKYDFEVTSFDNSTEIFGFNQNGEIVLEAAHSSQGTEIHKNEIPQKDLDYINQSLKSPQQSQEDEDKQQIEA